MQLYPTDWGFFSFIGISVCYAAKALHEADTRRRWRRVFATPTASGAAVIIGFYLFVGIADSIRFAHQGSTLTALDLVLTPLRTQVERSYSSPLALRGFLKESRLAANGVVREYPRLTYGGRHLMGVLDQQSADVARRGGLGAGIGLLGWGVLVIVAISARGTRLNASAIREWRSPLVVSGIVCALLGAGVGLAPYYHILGTDKVGTDVLYQTLKSIRTGLVLGTLTILISLPIALVLGLIAGFFRGWVDDVVQYLYSTLASIPGVLLIAAAALTLDLYWDQHLGKLVAAGERADLRLLGICVVLGLSGWTSLCRLLRAEVLKLRSAEYVLAARTMGLGWIAILIRHLVPNVLHLVVITAVIDFSGLVLAEAVLTYIDIGVDPSMESWGNMINSARLELAREPVVWWSLGAAFVFMFGLILAANLFADAVRDAFDPRLHGS
ncbi:MAG: ABC transporter permease [Gammaproteobacteria bacterium]